MAFKWLTQYNSPNYTPASRVQATWGQPRTVKAIAIHWWGDPNNNPSFNGIVNYLCRPGGNSSAHIVATGTGRQVACIVNLSDASWATNSANPYTISIECDPRCRTEDYDVVAEVVAQLRSIYGNIPLVPHKQFVATACPGNYDLNRINKIAATKQVSKSDPWGKVTNKVTTPTAPTWSKIDKVKKRAKAAISLYNVKTGAKVQNYAAKTEFELDQKTTWKGKEYLRTPYSSSKKIDNGFLVSDLENIPVVTTKEVSETQSVPFEKQTKDDNTLPAGETKVSVEGKEGTRTIVYTVTYIDGKETKRVVKSDKVTVQPVTEVTLVGSYEKPSDDGFNENDRNTLNSIQKLLEWLTNAFKAIFNIKDY